jgi:hypothetical protein
MARLRRPTMSKQLSFSAVISTIVMAAFVLASAGAPDANEMGATSAPAAPTFEATLPAR